MCKSLLYLQDIHYLIVISYLVFSVVSGYTINLKHDSGDGEYNSLIQRDSDTYILCDRKRNDIGYIKTFDVLADGSDVEVNSL